VRWRVWITNQTSGGAPALGTALHCQDLKFKLAALCSIAVAKLGMQQLAGTAKQLVVVSGVGSLPQARLANRCVGVGPRAVVGVSQLAAAAPDVGWQGVDWGAD
jgi:hypothetical protein